MVAHPKVNVQRPYLPERVGEDTFHRHLRLDFRMGAWFNVAMRLVWMLLALRMLICVPLASAEENNWPLLAKEAHARSLTQPTNPELLNLYGYYAYRAGDENEAAKALEASVRLKPAFPVAWNNLGVLQLNQKKYSEAETSFRNALATDPKYSKAKYNLAVTRFKQGYYREALSLYMDLRSEDKAYVDIRTNQGKAEKELDQALKENPADPFLRTVKSRYEKLKKDKADDAPRF
jgi:tetratricopeptide (TPR) repeat protein